MTWLGTQVRLEADARAAVTDACMQEQTIMVCSLSKVLPCPAHIHALCSVLLLV